MTLKSIKDDENSEEEEEELKRDGKGGGGLKKLEKSKSDNTAKDLSRLIGKLITPDGRPLTKSLKVKRGKKKLSKAEYLKMLKKM